MAFHNISSNICKIIPFSTFFGELFATLTTAGHGLKTLQTTRIDGFSVRFYQFYMPISTNVLINLPASTPYARRPERIGFNHYFLDTT
jgi:hypothetical protein